MGATGWGPPVIFVGLYTITKPPLTMVIATINHCETTSKATERYLGGPILYKPSKFREQYWYPHRTKMIYQPQIPKL